MHKPVINSVPQSFPHDDVHEAPDNTEDMSDDGVLDSPNISSKITDVVMKQVNSTGHK